MEKQETTKIVQGTENCPLGRSLGGVDLIEDMMQPLKMKALVELSGQRAHTTQMVLETEVEPGQQASKVEPDNQRRRWWNR